MKDDREKPTRRSVPSAAPAARPRRAAVKPATVKPATTPRGAGTKSAVETRALILHHTAKLLREHGFAAVSMRQIARDVNIMAGSIYYHFPSKEDLLFHVLEEGLRQVVGEVNQAVASLAPGTPFPERLRVVVNAHLRGVLQVGDYSSAYIRIYDQMPEDVRRRHTAARRAFTNWWERFFTEAMAEGSLRPDFNPSVVRVFVVAALNWTVEWYDPARGSLDALADQIYSIIAHGVVQDPPHKPRARK